MHKWELREGVKKKYLPCPQSSDFSVLHRKTSFSGHIMLCLIKLFAIKSIVLFSIYSNFFTVLNKTKKNCWEKGVTPPPFHLFVDMSANIRCFLLTHSLISLYSPENTRYIRCKRIEHSTHKKDTATFLVLYFDLLISIDIG